MERNMRGIASGCLSGQPIEKTSKAGKPYILATVVEKIGDKKRWLKAFIFSESACEEVRRLSDGDPISVAGEIDASVYQPDNGEARINWSIMVDAVLSARRKPKAKRGDEPGDETFRRTGSRAPADGAAHARRSWAAPSGMGGAIWEGGSR
jgi:single-stranded DNA-binding protein